MVHSNRFFKNFTMSGVLYKKYKKEVDEMLKDVMDKDKQDTL